ncbi:glycerophosphodiester phosphodiesterase family protein [bacterium]|nr:glycerophosphodiester phosphodiesterase family protein [bacterium]
MYSHQLIAHRGWQTRYIENTLQGLTAALEAGAKSIEADIQLTANNQPVLFHDRDLLRVCKREGRIDQLSDGEISLIRVGESDRLPNVTPQPLATLSELVGLMQRFPDSHLYLEIKRICIEQKGIDEALTHVLPLLDTIKERCTLISFSFELLLAAKQKGYAKLGVVLDVYDDWHHPLLDQISPDIVFCNVNKLPDACDIDALPYPVAIYEIADKTLASELLQAGAEKIETFAIGEMLSECADA